MTDLERELAHARTMAIATHKRECPWANPKKARLDSGRPIWEPRYETDEVTGLDYPAAMVLLGFAPEIPACSGCVTDADRALWSQLADEYANQLARHREDTLL